ncbi:MAG TPA: HD domain-containing protein [Candidatus Saccharimonadales bacterium]|nr:HD domain-containing protein [Candidatus Saccharimonadales bacterium]
MNKIKYLFEFYIQAEKLKTTMRHSWTNDSNRQESTAEHTWLLCLIAMTIFDELEVKVDQLKVLKMLIIHDLAEALIGDIPAFDTEGRKGKKEREKVAMEQLTKNLPKKTRNEIMELFEEMEEKSTPEAKIAQAIDKFEAPLQHNIADISTWDQNDYDIHGRYKMELYEFDHFLKELREELEHMTRRKVTMAKTLHRFRPEIQKYYEELNAKEEEK